MTIFSWILKIVCWIIAGAVAGRIMGLDSKGDRNGILVNLGLGIVGGLVGTLIAKLLGLGATNLIGSTLISIAGSCAAIGLARFLIKRK